VKKKSQNSHEDEKQRTMKLLLKLFLKKNSRGNEEIETGNVAMFAHYCLQQKAAHDPGFEKKKEVARERGGREEKDAGAEREKGHQGGRERKASEIESCAQLKKRMVVTGLIVTARAQRGTRDQGTMTKMKRSKAKVKRPMKASRPAKEADSDHPIELKKK